MATKTIILLEDDNDLRDLLALSLQTAGYSVISQGNSKNIGRLVEKHHAALVITDIVMPDHEGIEGITQIVDSTDVPILAISAYPQYLNIVNSIVTACLVKPVTGAQIVTEVRRILGPL